jgi:hypothetical protein
MATDIGKSLAPWRCWPHNGRRSPYPFGVFVMRHAALSIVLLLLFAPLGCKGKTTDIASTSKDDTTAKRDASTSKPDNATAKKDTNTNKDDTTGKKDTSTNKPGDSTLTAKDLEDRAIALVKKLGGVIERDDTKAGKPVVSVQLHFSTITDVGLKELTAL